MGLDQLALVPIVVYALFKGSIEYVAPLTIRLALAAAYAGRPQRGAAVMSPARERGP